MMPTRRADLAQPLQLADACSERGQVAAEEDGVPDLVVRRSPLRIVALGRDRVAQPLELGTEMPFLVVVALASRDLQAPQPRDDALAPLLAVQPRWLLGCRRTDGLVDLLHERRELLVDLPRRRLRALLVGDAEDLHRLQPREPLPVAGLGDDGEDRYPVPSPSLEEQRDLLLPDEG